MHSTFTSVLSLALCAVSVFAQIPFEFDGHLDGLTLDAGGAFNAGGTISVNGVTITVPKNLKVNFPAAIIPYAQLFANGIPQDFPSPSTNKYEVTVSGNAVDGKYIAGVVDIAELATQGGTGRITTVVSSADVGGSWLELDSGTRLFINDPNKVYSSGYTKYPFFTADEENPSISGTTGYPMCIPRSASDALCPGSNRPSTTSRNFLSPNPMLMAPFIVGDFVTYSGVKVGDKDVACYIITANVGIFTPAGTLPSYLFVEDVVIGVVTSDGNMEGAPSRFIGYASDTSAKINVYALDVDPCTGAETERLLGNTAPTPIVNDPRNKWEFRTNGGPIGKLTREYRIKVASGQKVTTNGINAGQYTSPPTEIIFPEVVLPGYTNPPLDFTNFGHLFDGSGAEEGSTDIYGPLSPWPGATAPTAKDCAPITTPAPTDPTSPSGPAPVSNAGPDVFTRPAAVLTLAGANTVTSIAASSVTYKWAQTVGPTLDLSSATIANPKLTLPAQTGTANITRTYELTVTANGQTSKDTVDIVSNATGPDAVTIDSYTFGTRQKGTLNVVAHSNVPSGGTMTISVNGGAAATMTAGGNGSFSYSASGFKANTPIRVTSSFKGTATTSTNTAA